jgi:hypothetical protein
MGDVEPFKAENALLPTGQLESRSATHAAYADDNDIITHSRFHRSEGKYRLWSRPIVSDDAISYRTAVRSKELCQAEAGRTCRQATRVHAHRKFLEKIFAAKPACAYFVAVEQSGARQNERSGAKPDQWHALPCSVAQERVRPGQNLLTTVKPAADNDDVIYRDGSLISAHG